MEMKELLGWGSEDEMCGHGRGYFSLSKEVLQTPPVMILLLSPYLFKLISPSPLSFYYENKSIFNFQASMRNPSYLELAFLL